jgi:hypothetical protein
MAGDYIHGRTTPPSELRNKSEPRAKMETITEGFRLKETGSII